MNTYKQAQEFVDFEPGSCIGKAIVDFCLPNFSTGVMLLEFIKKGEVLEYSQEKGLLTKKAHNPGCFVNTELSDSDNTTLQAYYKLLSKRPKVSDAEHMARSEGRATSRPGSCSKSSAQSSKEKWEERMFGSFCTVPVQLDDREKAYGTKAVSTAYF